MSADIKKFAQGLSDSVVISEVVHCLTPEEEVKAHVRYVNALIAIEKKFGGPSIADRFPLSCDDPGFQYCCEIHDPYSWRNTHMRAKLGGMHLQ